MVDGRQYHMNANRDRLLDDVIRRVAAEQQRNPEVLSRDFSDPRFANWGTAPVPKEPYMGGWLPAFADKIASLTGTGARWVDENVPRFPGGISSEEVVSMMQPLRGRDFGATGAHEGDVYAGAPRLVGAGLLGGKAALKAGRSLLPKAGRGITSGVSAAGRGIESGLGSMKNTVKSLFGITDDVVPAVSKIDDTLLPRLPDETLAAAEPVAQGSRISELPRLPGEGDEAAAKILGRDEFGSYKKPEPKLGDSDYVLKAGDPGYQPRLDPSGKVSVFEGSGGKLNLPKKAFSKSVDDLTRSDVRKLIGFRDEALGTLRNHSRGIREFSQTEIGEALDTIKTIDAALVEKGYLKGQTYVGPPAGNIGHTLDDFPTDIDDLVTLPGRAIPLSRVQPLAAQRNDLVRQLKEGAVSTRNIPGNQRMEGNPFWDNWQNMNRNPNVKKKVDEIVELEEKLIRSGWVDEASRTATSSDPSGWKVSIFD
jgi:hypothetical protein